MRLSVSREGLTLAKRTEMQPLEGTRISLSNTIIPNWWAENGFSTGAWFPGTAELAQRTWVAARCIQLNSQQIGTMPLRWHGSEGTHEPTWVSAPDPNWYPNGISDAIKAVVRSYYGWGYACLYVTDFYATGFPRTWTVLNPNALKITAPEGTRKYKYGEEELPARRIVQIDRDPGWNVTGTSALAAYAQLCWGLLAAGNQSMSVSQGAVPQAVLKMLKKADAAQAKQLQEDWMTATARRNGAPPVLPPDIDFSVLSFDPKDMALLETQEFNAKAIMTAFGIPTTLMNMALVGGLTYQNPAGLGEQWWRFELRPTSTSIANAFSAQMLPAGQSVSFDAQDTFAPIDASSTQDDEQLSQATNASPTQQPDAPTQQPSRPLTAVGGAG